MQKQKQNHQRLLKIEKQMIKIIKGGVFMIATCDNCDLYRRGECRPSESDKDYYSRHNCPRYE